jgi:hypothetical protein
MLALQKLTNRGAIVDQVGIIPLLCRTDGALHAPSLQRQIRGIKLLNSSGENVYAENCFSPMLLYSPLSGQDTSTMFKFLSHPWVPCTFPFLLILVCSETAFFLPQWRFQLYISGGILAAAMIYFWRDRVKTDLIPDGAVLLQTLVGIAAGACLGVIWFISVHMGISSTAPLLFPELWTGVRKHFIISFAAAVFCVIVPVVSELFWRSFLLRYFISPDFRSIPCGTFNLFAFVMVVVLGTLPTSNYTLYLFVSGLTYTCITLWSKNVYCSTIAHATANACIFVSALYLKVTFY